jgi:hypothetical protein
MGKIRDLDFTAANFFSNHHFFGLQTDLFLWDGMPMPVLVSGDIDRGKPKNSEKNPSQ